MKSASATNQDRGVLGRAEVVVVGGGLAGVAAAVAAARNGADTILVERSQMLGGVATAGLMASITNFYYTAKNELVVGGIATEVVQRLADAGAAPTDWRDRSCPHFTNDPEAFKTLLIDMCLEAGVRTLLDTWAVGAIGDGPTLKGIFVETKGGRFSLYGQTLIDAGGDAELAVWAGAPYHEDAARASLEFRMGNVDLEQLFRYFRDNPDEYPTAKDVPQSLEEVERHWRGRGYLFVPHGAGRQMKLVQEAKRRGELPDAVGLAVGLDALGMYGIAATGTAVINANFENGDALDPWLRSQFILDARRSVPVVVEFLRRNMPGFANAHLVATASEIGVRGTRWLDGAVVLREEDILSGRRFPDAVGMAPYRKVIDGLLQWLPHAADIPYGVMLPKGVEGLLVASGKSASTQPRGELRGQSRCMQLGEAAGTAAAMCAAQGCTPRQLDVRALQRRLLEQGVFLGDEALLRERGLA
ncbi:MAG: FAD-dependent oxidoreductase [Anaerolineae bacterium]|nr:FAD-dependent oxidoreductase [Anaerolineae bacterium]